MTPGGADCSTTQTPSPSNRQARIVSCLHESVRVSLRAAVRLGRHEGGPMLYLFSVRYQRERWICVGVQAVHLLITIIAMLIDNGEIEGLAVLWAFAFLAPAVTMIMLIYMDWETDLDVLALRDLQWARFGHVVLIGTVVAVHDAALQHTNVARIWLVELSSLLSSVLLTLMMRGVPWLSYADKTPWSKP